MATTGRRAVVTRTGGHVGRRRDRGTVDATAASGGKFVELGPPAVSDAGAVFRGDARRHEPARASSSRAARRRASSPSSGDVDHDRRGGRLRTFGDPGRGRRRRLVPRARRRQRRAVEASIGCTVDRIPAQDRSGAARSSAVLRAGRSGAGRRSAAWSSASTSLPRRPGRRRQRDRGARRRVDLAASAVRPLTLLRRPDFARPFLDPLSPSQ